MTATESRTSDRLMAVVEVLAVFALGTLLTRRALAAFSPAISTTGPDGRTDYYALAAVTTWQLAVQYFFLLGLAFLSARVRRRWSRRDYGFTLAGRSFAQLARTGAGLFCVISLPLFAVFTVAFLSGVRDTAFSVSPGLDAPHDAGYWLFMAVASFLIVPILEESFARGYVQARLQQDPASSLTC